MKNGKLLALALLSSVLGACAQGEASDGPTIQTIVVERSNLRITAEATGSVEPIRVVEVKSKASGEILRLHVDIGDRVASRALLAEVDPRDVRNGFEQARADLAVAEARLEISESQLQRSNKLLESGVITAQEQEGSRLDYANSQATLVKAQTNLELAELRLGDVTIRAPMAGTILVKNIEEGQVIQSASGSVSGGTTLLIMANLDEMQVRTLVDETDVGQILPGQVADVVVEAFPDRVFEGVVDKIEPQAVVEQNVTMFPVIVTLDNREGLLRPGMNAEVEMLVAERAGALTLPNNAIVKVEEMAPAAMVLGLDPGEIQLSRDIFEELYAELAGAQGTRTPAASGEETEGGGRARFQEIRAQVESGEISQDSARTLMGAARGQQGGGRRGQGGDAFRRGGQPGQRGQPGQEQHGSSSRRRGPQPAITFVVSDAGVLEVRPVLVGVNDWDNTEVVAGLQEGDLVALIGAAQLQARQQEFLDRIRDRRGGFGGSRR